MYGKMLAEVICLKFESDVGKGQVSNPRPPMLNEPTGKVGPKAFVVTFRTSTNYDIEEGYRQTELLLYGPHNYVQVWTRDTWDICSHADMEDGDDGEMVPKKGKTYTKGSTEWKLIGDHDSCWRESVERFLTERKKDINGFCGPFSGFSVMQPPPELEQLKEKQRAR